MFALKPEYMGICLYLDLNNNNFYTGFHVKLNCFAKITKTKVQEMIKGMLICCFESVQNENNFSIRLIDLNICTLKKP